MIIDDEPNSRELLKNMLNKYCPEVEVVGEGVDVKTGISVLQLEQPDIVFLDIEMPGGTGFNILNALDNQSFNLIFVTGYDKYAIKAIKYAALDYILKPVGLKELKMAVLKAQQNDLTLPHQIRYLESHLSQSKKFDTLILPDKQNHQVLNFDDIYHLDAEGNYSVFHLSDGKELISSYALSYYEKILTPPQFFRIHKSHIINMDKISKFAGGRTGSVLLQNGKKLDIAARRKAAFLQIMNERNI